MRIAIFANTPAQLYFFKNIVKNLKGRGHQVRLLIRDHIEIITIARELKLDYIVYSKLTTMKSSKMLSLPFDVFNAYKILCKFKPDTIIGMGVYDAFTASLLGATCLEFEDTEPAINKISYSIQFKIYLPFVDAIITPKSFIYDFGDKQIRVNSFKELAYLHPNYYEPDESIKGLLGLNEDEEYVLLRFNAFDALHDFRVAGFSSRDKIRLVKEIKKYTRVFISSEAEVPGEIEDYVIKIPKSRIHDAIFYAKMMIADTGTMVTEAACLGTPAIMLHPSIKNFGNFMELQNEYGLIFGYDQDPSQVIEKAIELIRKPNLKEEWKAKRSLLLNDKVDMTLYMVDAIENSPKLLSSK